MIYFSMGLFCMDIWHSFYLCRSYKSLS